LSNFHRGILNSCINYVQRRSSQPCKLCGASALGGPICGGCREDLPYLAGAACPLCARPTPSGEVCGACLKRPPAFDLARAVFAYAHPVNVLVQQLKYGRELALSGYFAACLAARLGPGELPDLIVPMPLHPARLRHRGYNQAAEIGRALASRLDIPMVASACRRVRDTPPQTGLDLAQRRRNLRRAFACGPDVSGRRVALVDDVMTSGASLNELAKTVRAAGAAEVRCWVLARTLRG
jgi:ComF family protein